MEIKILGPGCANCQRLGALTEQAVKELGVEANVQHVTDMKSILSYGVLGTPALVVDGKVRISGRVPSKAKVVEILTTALAEKG
jgi:small redox-active disulfide protein 2